MAAMMVMGLAAGCGNADGGNSSSGNANAGNSSSGQTSIQDASGGQQSDAGSGEVEQVSLKVWIPEEEMEITQAMCEAFDEAHPEYDCTFDIAVVGIDESVNNLETDPELAADVFQMPSGSISQLKDEGLIYPITVNVDEVKSLYGAGAVEACTRDDLLYGVPHSPNSFFMYYNKSMYTEEDVKSLETMMAKDLGDDVYNFSYTLHDSWYLETFFYAAGCTLFGDDGMDPTDCTWNNENGIMALNYVIDLVNNPKYIEDRDSIAGSLMNDYKLGALCSGTWSADGIQEALGDDFGACALPTITLDGKECQLRNFADYKCYAVKSNTSAPMAAQLLAEWFANEENQLTRYEAVKATPTCVNLMNNAEVANDIATVALIAQTEYAVPQPSISQINNYWTPVASLGESILQGDVTSANAQESLDTVVETILSSISE